MADKTKERNKVNGRAEELPPAFFSDCIAGSLPLRVKDIYFSPQVWLDNASCVKMNNAAES
jgi:hypothetical protein